MAMGLQNYPPSIPNVPRGLTAARPLYVFTSVVVLVSLFLFLLLYLALVAGSGWLIYLAITYPVTSISRGAILLKGGSIACSVMLFLFLVKGLFKRQRWNSDGYVEITEGDQPGIYAFVRRLCREVGAPFPHRVYVTPDVDAHVFYDTSLLNLVLPVRKNLAIGLGLMNVVTLNEFKAVLAHEFGHFSQTGMAISNYAWMANRIVRDMVFGEDVWDEWLDQWKQMDFRLAIFGWFMGAVVWLLRWALGLIYMLLNLAQFAMMRQMEFQADLVAASVTGSDALCHALCRLRTAAEALERARDNLRGAAHQGRFSRDLYYHQDRELERLRKERRDPKLGIPPALPPEPDRKVQVFPPEETSSIWSTHPSLYAREENLKRRYLRSEDGGVSPWTIVKDPAALRARVTMEMYRLAGNMPGMSQLAAPEEVERVIGRTEEVTFNERYLGLYDSRFVEPGDAPALAAHVRTQPWAPQRIAQVYDKVYGGKLAEFLEARRKRQAEASFLASVEAGATRVNRKGFEFRGARRRPQDVPSLLRMVEAELEEDRRVLNQLDGEVFLAHYQMALAIAPAAAPELLARYDFHQRLQGVLRQVQEETQKVVGVIQFAQSRPKLTETDVRQINQRFRQSRAAVLAAVESVGTLYAPPGIEALGALPLGRFLAPDSMVPDLYGETALPDGEWVQGLMRTLEGLHDRTRAVHYQSLGAILALQERLAGAWRSAARLS